MSAMPDNIVPFQLPKKPRIREKDAPPDQRKVCVLPIRAVFDQELTHGALQVLAAVCAYANRAGITWVSQTRLAKELGISQQAVAKQFKQLRQRGYLETIRKGFKGERTDTLRVIFDPSVDAETAMAVTSSQEDTRPPVIQKEQAMQAEKPDPEGQIRIAQMIAKAFKPVVTKKEYSMPKGNQSRTVKEMHEGIQKAKGKRSQSAPNHNPQVVNEDPLHSQPQAVDNYSHSQPNHNLEVVNNTENTVLDKDIYKPYVLHNQKRIELREQGLSDDEIDGNLEILLAAYQAEGLTPNPDRLATEIADLAKVGRGIA